MRPVPVLTLTEAAERLGISKQRAHQLVEAGRAPRPFAESGFGRLWTAGDVEAWRAERAERGLPPTSGNGNGGPHTRAERAAEVARLRAEGFPQGEIAARLGISHQYVSELIVDTDASKRRARLETYRKPCPDCGAPTSGNDGPSKPPRRCYRCATKARTRWTKEAIVAAIRDFAELVGHPPHAADFNPATARARGQLERAARYAENDWPVASCVVSVFGTWNAAIAAAGFEPTTPGARGRA